MGEEFFGWGYVNFGVSVGVDNSIGFVGNCCVVGVVDCDDFGMLFMSMLDGYESIGCFIRLGNCYDECYWVDDWVVVVEFIG